MATQVQLRRGTSTQNDSFTGAQGELTFDTTNKRVRIHDGATAGGFELKTENAGGDTLFADNEKAIFGAGSDIEISSNGTSGIIRTGNSSSDIRLESDNRIVICDRAFNETFAVFNDDGDVKLYHNGSKKFETTSTGINVTGTVTADGLTVAQSNPTITITDTDGSTNTTLKTVGSNTELSNPSGGNLRFRTNASELERMRISPDGDISFYEDTGTTAKFFWDASTERLGIGTTTVQADLHLGSASPHIDIGPSAGNRGKVGFDSNNVYIGSTSGTGEIHFKNNISSADSPHSSGDTKMVITDSGVGIGTSSPVNNSNRTTLGLQGVWGGQLDIMVGSTVHAQFGTDNFSSGQSCRIQSQDGIVFKPSSGEAMRIDSSGRVGIGTSTPSQKVEVSNNANSSTWLKVSNTDTGTGAASGVLFGNNSGDTGAISLTSSSAGGNLFLRTLSTNALTLGTNNTERMRIDSSGNLLVGKTTLEYENTDGHIFRNDGFQNSTRSSGNVNDFNRLTNDGEITRFSSDGTTAGRIGVTSNRIFIGSGNTGIFFDNLTDNAIKPWNTDGTATARDAAIDIGHEGERFKDLYLSGGVYLGGVGSANKLDDYEEGTWNPTFTEQSAGTGTYTKIGRTVQVWGEVICDANGAGVNALALSGLPFSVLGDTYRIHLGFDSMNTSANGNNIPTPFNGMMLMQHDQYVRPSSTGGNPYFKSDLFVIGTRVYISGQFETTA